MNPSKIDPSQALAETRGWVELAVIGLNLCPFAKAPWTQGRIRYRVCLAAASADLLAALDEELALLAAADARDVETTLLVHPCVLNDFDDFNDFLDLAESLLEDRGWGGVIQLASFHPDYRFAGTAQGDLSNATNRSPHPTLHLLREASLDCAVEAFPEAEPIFEANIRTLESLGADGWAGLQARIRHDARNADADADRSADIDTSAG